MKKLIMIALLLMVNTIQLHSQTKVGITAANFLTIPVGARASAMGGAFVAVANDGSSAFWNPAGLSRIPHHEVNVTHAQWLVNTDLNWLGLALKHGNGTIGISVNQLDYGREELTTEMNPNGTGQHWEAQDLAIILSYAHNLTDRFAIGGSFKYIQQKIWHESADALAFDVGLLFDTQYHGLRIGMNIANFGTEMKMNGKDLYQPVDIDPGNAGNNDDIIATMDTDSWSLPLFFTIGASMELMRNRNWLITMATDATHPNNQKPFLNAGTEIIWHNFLALRAGYNSLFKLAAEEGLSLGFGFRYKIGDIILVLDYGYMDFGVFDGVSRYSFAVRF